MRNIKQTWNKIYQSGSMDYLFEEDILNIIKIFKKNNLKRILDLGCGSGKYIELLSREGFEIYGIDISEEAIKIAKAMLRKENLNAELVIGLIHEKLPYNDNFFDGIISIKSFYHGTLSEIRYGISELERILKPDGLIYLTLRKKASKVRSVPHKYIAPHTYVPLEGNEKDLIHYFFNKKGIKKEFYRFKLIKLSRSKDYYYFLGKKV